MKLNRNTWLSVAIIVLVGVYGWLEHQAHVLEYRDYIFFAAFIGIHLLMHMGHGHAHDTQKSNKGKTE